MVLSNTRTYVKKYAVLDTDLDISVLTGGQRIEARWRKGDRISIEGTEHYVNPDNELVIRVGTTTHRLSRDSYHLIAETQTINI